MVKTLTVDQFFKSVDYRPHADSDGGSNYIDNTDSLDAAKFNDRFNANNNMMKHLQKMLEYVSIQSKSTQELSFIIPTDDINEATRGERPFKIERRSGNPLTFEVNGFGGCINDQTPQKMIFPLGEVIDLVDVDSPEYALDIGDSNRHGIFYDYPTTSKRWYTVGHDGAEGVPAVIRYANNPAGGVDWASMEVKFYDYDDNPTSYPQIIGVESTTNSEFVRLYCEDGETNYRIYSALWTGSALTTRNDEDSGVARSVGEHKLTILCKPTGTVVYLDGTEILNYTETIQTVHEAYFESTNTSGSADHIDIYYFHIFRFETFTAVANQWNYVHIDLSDYSLKCASSLSSQYKLLYAIYIKTGETTIPDTRITDYRDLSRFIGLGPLNLWRIMADEALITTIDATTINATTVNAALVGNVTGNVSGNAGGSATTLATARAIGIIGEVLATGVNFDGSAAINMNTTIKKAGHVWFVDTAAKWIELWDGTETLADYDIIILNGTWDDSTNQRTINHKITIYGTQSAVINVSVSHASASDVQAHLFVNCHFKCRGANIDWFRGIYINCYFTYNIDGCGLLCVSHSRAYNCTFNFGRTVALASNYGLTLEDDNVFNGCVFTGSITITGAYNFTAIKSTTTKDRNVITNCLFEPYSRTGFAGATFYDISIGGVRNIVIGNVIDSPVPTAGTATAIKLLAAADDCIISNNICRNADIVVDSGSTYNIITSNNVSAVSDSGANNVVANNTQTP